MAYEISQVTERSRAHTLTVMSMQGSFPAGSIEYARMNAIMIQSLPQYGTAPAIAAQHGRCGVGNS